MTFQHDGQLNIPNNTTGNSSPHEEFPGFSSPNDVEQSGTYFAIRKLKEKWKQKEKEQKRQVVTYDAS